MPQYDSTHTGEEVDNAVGITLGNKGKGSNKLPVYLDVNGNAVPVNKDAAPTQNSTNIVESGGVFTQLSTKVAYSDVDTNPVLGTSNTKVPSTSAVEGYVGGAFTTKQDKLVIGEGLKLDNNVLSFDESSDYVTVDKLDNRWNHFTDKLKVGDGQDLVAIMEEARRSTFDRSKFTVEPQSNPAVTINDKGIASGFTTESYIYTDVAVPASSRLEFLIKTDLKVSVGNSERALFSLVSGSTCLVEARCSADGQSITWVYATGEDTRNTETFTFDYVGKVLHKVLYDKGNLYLFAGNSITTLFTVGVIENVYPLAVDKVKLGVTYGNTLPLIDGTIDLKGVVVRENGMEIFCGNRGGADLLKSVNFTAVANSTDYTNPVLPFSQNGLTISEDGIARGFNLNATNNIQTVEIPFSTANTWEIYTPTFNISQFNGVNCIMYKTPWSAGYDGIGIFVRSTGKISWCCQATLGTMLFKRDANTKIELNVPYRLKMEFTGSRYNLYLSSEGDDFMLVDTYESSEKPSYNIAFMLGTNDAHDNVLSNGYLDLNTCKIVLDGQLVYQPMLSIPYNVTPTGEKIVDEFYRDRVKEEFEQVGYTPYYTLEIDETPRFEKLGNIVVSHDWIASGFSSGGYNGLAISEIDLSAANSFEIIMPFTTPGTLNSLQRYIYSGVNFNVSTNNLSYLFYINLHFADDTTAVMYDNNILPRAENTSYGIRLTYDSTNGYKAYYRVGTGDWILHKTNSTTKKLKYSTIGNLRRIGTVYDAGAYAWDGSVNLKEFAVYVDGKLVYRPIEPPDYTMATVRNTSEVVTESAFGEDSSLFLRQHGTCTANSAVSLPKAYINSNYFVSVPVSAKSTTGFTPTQDGDWIAEGYISI